MDLDKIRSLNDEELENYLRSLSERSKASCVVCKKPGTYTVNIQNKRKSQQKKLCSLCEKHYNELLDYLKIQDILWD